MKESYWGYWLIALGVFIIVIMMLISNITTKNTQDYYLIKEVTEASMVDAVNYGYYREYGELKIDREKFIESFLRRFAENVSLNTYQIDFYDIYEAPPKVSVKVTSKSGSFVVAGDSATFDIVNKVDAILELTGQEMTAGNGGANLPVDTPETNNQNNANGGYNPSVDKIPDAGYVTGFAVSVVPDNYYECPGKESVKNCNTFTLKEKYAKDKEALVNQILIDWQEYYGITFSASEKNEFLKVAKADFNIN